MTLERVKVWAQAHLKALIIVGVLILVVLFLYGKFNGIHREGIDRETALTAQYLDNQNELSSFIATFYEQLGIADRKSEQLDRILEDAVKGRYDDTGLSAATPNESNDLISAIVEAYPDLSGLDTYDTIMDTISSGRDAYKQKQTKLLDMLRSYDRWRKQDIIGSVLISIAGHPSSSLRAQVGERIDTGQDALDRMYQIVLTTQAAQAYETGTLDPLEIPALGENP